MASATATLTLDRIDNTGFPGFPGPTWQYAGIEYELEPVPELTTLLLWGTGAAGVGLVRSARNRARRLLKP